MDTRPNFVCVDTRPKLCVWIRVPSCVYGYASRIVCMDTRPNFVHGYASQINVPTRVCTHNVHVYTRPKLCVWIRVPSCVYGYASQVVCMDTRPNFVYGYASQLECLYDFYVNSMVFYGIFMISMVNSMVFPRICVFFVKLLMKVRIFVSFVLICFFCLNVCISGDWKLRSVW